MLFSSITFLYYFLPLAAALYFTVPGSFKNIALLSVSIIFYGWGEPRYILIMGASVCLGYACGLLIDCCRHRRARKVLCAVSVVISLSFLLYFKYADFFIENLNAAAGTQIALIKTALPIGISFYTFQLISYTIDVYRGEPAQKNFVSLAAYISMFPQLIAGPIVRYADIAAQLKSRVHTWETAAEGVRRFVIGLAKKVLLANQLGELCSVFRESGEKSVLFFWMYAAAFSLHVYFDFSGYSDMAIGLGRIFGFHFLENFDYPFVSASITEFWRRWHMSLGSWFRDYVYIPLGGGRCGRGRQLLNILIVWMLTGFWHGAAWNFILWGLYFAVLLMIEKLWLLRWLKKRKILAHIYTLFLVMASFVIFNAGSLGQVWSDLGGLFGAGGIPLVSAEALYYLKSYAVVLLFGIIGAAPFMRSVIRRISNNPAVSTILNSAEPVFAAVVLLVVTAYLVDGSFNPFLYFRF